ncbi:hypothetical protein PGTUg99_001531 [Puccinia graminis f. sp. tritici]|uniref:Uncharacterized protein n=1 Tax=Puccinia graminis f. sp. tritici TaxID=56615 RepID=A0A5B0NA62_PUCGR|nr:hypothetical protein PGTUg99_001531 [Puccinia graminis f. sp. tritici]
MLATSSVMAAWMAVRVGLESGLAPGVMDWISHRPELATPVTGWKQLKEGIYLFQEGLDPYDSGVFHQSPLLLHLFSFVHSPILVASVYGLVDCYSAWILLRLFRSKWPRLTGPVKSMKLNDDRWMLSPTYQIDDWQLILLSVDRMAFSMFSLSIGTHLSVYPVLLVPSCIGIILDQKVSKSKTVSSSAIFHSFRP